MHTNRQEDSLPLSSPTPQQQAPKAPKSSPLDLRVFRELTSMNITDKLTSSSPTDKETENMVRSESFAYANSAPNHMSRLVLFFRSHSTAVTATVGFLIFILLVTSDAIMKGGSDGYAGLRP